MRDTLGNTSIKTFISLIEGNPNSSFANTYGNSFIIGILLKFVLSLFESIT